MVLGRNYLNKKKDYFYLKYFFQLWEWWIASGGRAHGIKVFRGHVNYCTTYAYNYNFAYKIWNEPGIIQILFKTLKMNFTSALVFYPGLGLISINPLEDLHEPFSFIRHTTYFTSMLPRGDSLILKNSKIGLVIFSIQSYKTKLSRFARSSGCYGKILKKSDGKIFVQLPSSKIYIISEMCSATLGLSSKKNFWKLVKAGESRYISRVPKVRGIAMNPVDHPHGGWTNKGCHPVTPSGFLTKGVKTRKTNTWSKNKIYISRIKSLSA